MKIRGADEPGRNVWMGGILKENSNGFNNNTFTVSEVGYCWWNCKKFESRYRCLGKSIIYNADYRIVPQLFQFS